MNTTTPRARAGRPYVMPLHRAMPIDFVLPDEDEQAVRDGFDRVMKMPISKPIVPQPLRDSEREATQDLRVSSLAFWIWSGAMWTGCWFGLGVIYARHFS